MALPRFLSSNAFLSLSLLAGCGPTLLPATPDAGPQISPDAAISEAPPSCELAQAPLARAVQARSVLVTPSSFFLGDDRGLWRSSRIDERFERVASLEAEAVSVNTLIRTDDGAIFAVLGYGQVATSRDEGAHWERLADLPSTGFTSAPRLYTDGERVVGTAGIDFIEGLYDLDRETGLWTEIVAEPPVEGSGHFGLVMVGVDRGTLLATPSGYRTGGLFRLDRGAPRWERIEDLGDANGFTTFARRGEVAVVANQLGIWTEIEGAYRRVLTQELDRPRIVATADGFFGVDGRSTLRSNDGLEWVVEPLTDGAWPLLVSESGGRIATLRGDLLSPILSEDRGASWSAPSIVSQTFGRVSIHGGGEERISYVSPASWWLGDGDSIWQHGAWAQVDWPIDLVSAVAMTESGAWVCSYEGCAHRTDEGEAGPMFAVPDSPYAHEAAAAFATSHGLFMSPRPYGTPCGVVQPGLVVLRNGATTWEDASAGLRTWSPQCAGTPSVASVTAMFDIDGVLWATQAHDSPESAFVPVVLRSDDGGRSWTEVRAGSELVALVQADAGTFGLFRPGMIEALDAGSFAPTRQRPGELITDLVALDGRLVAATRDANGSALWMSDDGACGWLPLVVEDRIGPIADLDANGSTLAIASSTSGLWEASGCFAQ